MRKKLIILAFLFLIFPFFVSAYTKGDIIKLVDNQKLCDQETENMYIRYFNLYSRLLKTKNISNEIANQIYDNITKALKIVNDYNMCSIDDLDRIPSSKKSALHDYLYESSKLIIKSPDLENNDTNVKYNEDGSIDIYNNGEYLDKVSLKKEEFNYVGFSKYFVYFKYFLPSLLIIFLFFLIKTRKKAIINSIFTIMFALCLFGNIFYFKFGSFTYDVYNLVKSLNYKESSSITPMKVKNKKIITYPTYGSKYGTLKINNLNIELPIYYGDSKDILKAGIGHSLSFPGFSGTTILSGHNSKIFLNNLKNIKFDNAIIIETNYGIFKYKVVKIETLNKNQYKDLMKKDKSLIIYTCYPFDQMIYSEKRFVVYANLVEEEWYND